MLRLSLPAMVVSWLLLPTLVTAEELPERIIEYFAGKWTYTGPEQGQTGSVEWKVVAGGKALAGPGTDSKNGDNFSFAKWQATDKAWVHEWCNANGGDGHLEIVRFESGTYFGKVRFSDGSGKAIDGEARVKILDDDHYEYIVIAGDMKQASRWQRQK